MTSLKKPIEAAPVGHPKYSQTLPCAPSTAEVGRKLVRDVLDIWRLDDLADQAELIVTELIANACKHTRSSRIRLVVGRPSPIQVHVGVVDRDPSRLPALERAGAEDESGRGLLIIGALAERWGCDLQGSATRPWGKEVWAELCAEDDE